MSCEELRQETFHGCTYIVSIIFKLVLNPLDWASAVTQRQVGACSAFFVFGRVGSIELPVERDMVRFFQRAVFCKLADGVSGIAYNLPAFISVTFRVE